MENSEFQEQHGIRWSVAGYFNEFRSSISNTQSRRGKTNTREGKVKRDVQGKFAALSGKTITKHGSLGKQREKHRKS